MDFQLQILKLNWINGTADDSGDLCLHGRVKVVVAGELLDSGENEDWTLSAGALRMLRSLRDNHVAGQEEHLLPCCGHFMFIDDRDVFNIIGCPSGIDWSVLHEGKNIKLVTQSGKETLLSHLDYKNAVFEFSDKIRNFFTQCSPKKFPDSESEKCFRRFWKEWDELRKCN